MKPQQNSSRTLYLCEASFEERCLAFPRDIPSPGPNDKLLLLDFQGYFNVPQYCKNLAEMKILLEGKRIHPQVVECWVKFPMHALAEVKNQVPSDSTWDQIVMDMSALPRTYIFLLTDYLKTLTRQLVVRYTKPVDYGDELSRGAGSPSPIPTFEGSLSSEAEKILILILGFEGNKSEYVWEVLSPRRTILLIGDPPYEPPFVEEARKRNRFLLEMQRTDIIEDRIHTSDLEAIFTKLERLYLQCFEKIEAQEKTNILVCPLGTKPQSLATYLFAKKYSHVPIIYVSSAYYFTEKYSRGIGETITYDVSALLHRLGIDEMR